MASEPTASGRSPRIAMSAAAATKLKALVENHPEPVMGLRLKIARRGSDGFEHLLTLVEQGYEPEGDAVLEVEGITIFVEEQNIDYLDGVAIHYEDKGTNVSGLEFDNPNPLWTDPVALQIQELFDSQINPSIAAHGGWVSLLDVKEERAFVELGGGCQGCGMADVTLKQGIETAVKETVPQITEVVDVTDHAAGSNPYFQQSKK